MNPSEPIPATPAAPAAPAPLSERERIYAEHFNVPPPQAAPAEPVAPVAVAPVAPVELAAPVDPATPPPLTTEQVLQSVVSELADIKKKLAPPPAPAPAAPAADTSADQADWLALMAAGKREEADEALARMVAKKNAALQQQSNTYVLQQVAAERTMQEFTATVRSSNADIAELESYIAPRVQLRLNEAVQNGTVKSPADYATVYCETLADEAKQARNLYQRIRGAGASAAAVRQSEVVAAPTLVPQPVNTAREQAPPQEPQVETPEMYLQRRLARANAQRGLSVA